MYVVHFSLCFPLVLQLLVGVDIIVIRGFGALAILVGRLAPPGSLVLSQLVFPLFVFDFVFLFGSVLALFVFRLMFWCSVGFAGIDAETIVIASFRALAS